MGTAAFLMALGLLVSQVARAEDSAGRVLFKVAPGGHLLPGGSNVVPDGLPEGSEERTGVLGSTSFFFNPGGRVSYGLGMDIEGNGAWVRDQFFGIATLRALGQVELVRHPRPASRDWKHESYALLGAGWNFNSVGAKITYFNGAPAGAALDLQVKDSPALRLGLGHRVRVTKQGLMLTGETGWEWNQGSYRMTFSGSPDRTGDYNLSGFWLLLGISVDMAAALRPAPTSS